MDELEILQYLQKSLDRSKWAEYPCGVGIFDVYPTASLAISPVMSLTARRVSLSNPRNNRSLPQNLWDVIERYG